MATTTLPYRSIAAFIWKNVRDRGERQLFRALKGGSWHATSWGEAGRTATKLAAALKAKGVQPGNCLGIYSYNRPEWFLLDFAGQFLQAPSVPIYMNSTGEQVGYILGHTKSVVVLVDSPDKLANVLSQNLPDLRFILTTFDPQSTDPRVMRFEAMLESGTEPPVAEVEGWLAAIPEDSVATIIFTSGTTGVPKGVQLTHRNVISVLSMIDKLLPELTQENHGFSYLPLAHVAQRAGDLAVLFTGNSFSIADDILRFPELIKEVKPTFVIVVPRVLEKVYAKVKGTMATKPPVVQALFAWAEKLAHEYYRQKQIVGVVSPWVQAQWFLADKLVYKKIREQLGGNLRMVLSGGAALPAYIGEFFFGIGLPVLEVYGLTETSALISAGPLSSIRYGTVNRPLPGTEVRLEEDGEILFRGPNLTSGYFNNDEANAEAFTEDGWFRTGDLGSIDADGYLSITGRKKEIIVTSGGKNIPPVPVETALKQLPFISQVVVVGDERPFLTALLTLNPEECEGALRAWGETVPDRSKLHEHPALLKRIKEHVDAVNATLLSYTTVKRYTVLERDLLLEKGEITPSLKVRRRAVAEHFKHVIDGMYEKE